MTTEAVATAQLVGVWTVVPDRSSAGFRVRDKLVGHTRGTLPVRSGTVRVGADGTVETARVELDVAGVDTANKRRDGHLRQPQFLAAEQHPTILVQAGATPGGAPGWSVAATLVARGPRRRSI